MKYSPNRAEVYKKIPEGKNWRYIRDSGLFSQQELEEFMGGAYSSTGGRVGFWRRLSYDKDGRKFVGVQRHPTSGGQRVGTGDDRAWLGGGRSFESSHQAVN